MMCIYNNNILTALLLSYQVLLVPVCYADEFNSQLMPRVTERINEFMKVPVEAAKHFVHYHEIGGFEHNTTAIDRKDIYKYLYAYMSQKKEDGYPISFQLSLDDGTVVGFRNSVTEGYYREPGNSGYKTTNIDKDDIYYKHWTSCFNVTTGDPENCTLPEGNSYIECVDDCNLIPCPIEVTNSTVDSTTNETIWCRNYVEKKVLDAEQRGYVPAMGLCINPKGEVETHPEQFESYVVDSTVKNCYNIDWNVYGKIKIVGDFAVCGGNGTICDWAYPGVYDQQEYDHRFRPFYQTIKKNQKPSWIGPTPFATGQFLHVAYYHPIYYTEAYDSTDNRKVFQGVIAGRYDISMIHEYLHEQFSKTTIQVMIIDALDPYNIIAISSKDSSTAMKAALIADETQPCPDTGSGQVKLDTSLCKLIRVPVSDLKSSDADSDVLLYRAFATYQEKNFPTKSTMNVKVSDTIGSAAYAMQGDMYQLPDSNLSWHVLALLPMERDSSDAAMPGDQTFFLVCFIAILGFVGCLTLFIQFHNKRNERAMVQADWRFTCAFIFGCSMLNLSSLTMLGENTDQTCMLRMWSFNGLFSCALSPLFVKVWRMSTLLQASKGFKRKAVSNCTAFLYTFPLIVAQLSLLFAFSFIDPPRQTEKLGVGSGVGVHQITCAHETNAFFLTQVVFDGFLVFLGCILAYRTKDMDPKYGEAKQLAFSMYNIAFTGMFVIATVHLVDLSQVGRMVLVAVGVFWASFFSSAAFVLPRLLEVASESSLPLNSRHKQYSLSRSFDSFMTPANLGIDNSPPVPANTNPSVAIDADVPVPIPLQCLEENADPDFSMKENKDVNAHKGDSPFNDLHQVESKPAEHGNGLQKNKDNIFEECWDPTFRYEVDSLSSKTDSDSKV